MAKKTKAEEIDPNFIINAFRQDDPTIPLSARTTGAPAKEETAEEPEPEEEPRSETTVSPAPAQTVKSESERRRKQKSREQEYLALFMKEATISARMGKTVYVRKEFHERIQLILRIIGKDEVSLFSYIDNVLAHHLNMFEEEIKKLYTENSPIF